MVVRWWQCFFNFVAIAIMTVFAQSGPEVTIGEGTLVGRYWVTRGNRTIEGYQGIPFGKPPMGDLRFEAPQPAEPWSGVRMADTMPPVCMQATTQYGPPSEDCLFLNVFTVNAKIRPLLPVMVFTIGDAFEFAGISLSTPEYIMDEDIVFVTIQHRVGLFGFLSTNDGVLAGNQGLKDLRLGLRWLHDNIHNFGGDPQKVTIAGHSSGGSMTHALMLFNAHEGLFRAGITQSFSSMVYSNFQPPREVQRAIHVLTELSSCPSDTTELARCLKAKTAEEINDLLKMYKRTTLTGVASGRPQPQFRMVLEPECVQDRVITENPWNKTVTLPWITGVNSYEGITFIEHVVNDNSNILFSLFNAYLGDVLYNYMNYKYTDAHFKGVTEAVRSFYFDNRPISRETYPELARLVSDIIVIYGSYEAMLRGNTSRTYVYVNDYIGDQNNYVSQIPEEYRLGPDHIADTKYLFPDVDHVVPDRVKSANDDMMSKKYIKLWTNFVKNLQPTSHGDEIQWKPFGCERNYLTFTLESFPIFPINQGFFPERMKFWQKEQFPLRGENLGSLPCGLE